MKIAIIGYGRMGHAVEKQAKASGIEVAAIIDPRDEAATGKRISAQALAGADVAIDFSTAGAVLGNIRELALLKKDVAVGTTGWYDHIDEVRGIVESSGIGLVYSPNFSVGVNIFFQLAKRAAILADKFDFYDPYVYEMHHNQKTDAPGGTAKALGEIILGNVKRKKKMAFDRVTGRKIDPEELHVVSIRAGTAPGTHVLGFDGPADTIEMTHTARSMAGFVEGSLIAAQWVAGKKGLYTMEDFMESVLAGK